MRKSILCSRRWEARVHDCYHMIESCQMTSADALAYVKQTIDDELNRKHGARFVYSVYERGFVRGMCRVRDNGIWQLVEYCYLGNGVLFSTHKQSTHRLTEEFYSSGRGSELGNLPSGFYWKGTDKPWFSAGETTPVRGWDVTTNVGGA